MSKYVYTLDDIRDEMRELRKDGAKRGAWTGFDELFEYYSCKRGSYTIIFAGAHQGKSQFSFEVAMNLAQYSGWRFAVASPETGSPKDVFAELCWVYGRKPFLENDKGVHQTEEEAVAAMNFVREHFYVLDSGLEDFDVKKFYKEVRDLEYSLGQTIHGCLIDPYTEFKNSTLEGVRDDIAIGEDLTEIRKQSSRNNYHTIVTVHTKHQQNKYHKGTPYLPEANFGDIAGGQMWSRKGFMIINLWRCPDFLEDENGRLYDSNQVKVSIRKGKPKSAGKVGSLYMWYDPIKNRYYTKRPDGNGDYLPEPMYSKPDPNGGQQTEIKI